MEDYFPSRLKRKGLEDVTDDFSDFPLTSPARKIRRLDAGLPPIIEEEESDIPIEIENWHPNEQSYDINSTGGIKIEELPDEPVNEERAIVLFNPNNTNPLLQTPSNFSVSIDPSLVSGLKNQVLWSNQPNHWTPSREPTPDDGDDSTASSNGSLAVVPWVPSTLVSAQTSSNSTPAEPYTSEMMDTQEMDEAAAMEVEDNYPANQTGQSSMENPVEHQFHQWQQQHCVLPQPPPSTAAAATPIVWYR
ncbi:uncharacterized protein LOC127239976 isoform X2 [Andrographis paniculata]|uniref:uncharacterized protein LOC127239976 isoform X2 n=1 Tax=Andrographis paniculata TaxID=175694 RepID=UPI0021E80EE5|nr:uncharacterized protein LOC127239976 isoform X2 [Andrographis paniculata]